MLYRLAADGVLVAHGAFVVFALLGGLLALWWRWAVWVHLPTAAWAVLIELFGWICPLTPLENWLRQRAGQTGYPGGFIEHYLLPVIYPAGLTRGVQFVLAGVALGVNVAIYWWVLRRRKD